MRRLPFLALAGALATASPGAAQRVYVQPAVPRVTPAGDRRDEVDHVDLVLGSLTNTRAKLIAIRVDPDGTSWIVPATWSSSNTSAISVSVTGVITAKAMGTSKITATVEGVSAQILGCSIDPAQGVTVVPLGATLTQGSVTQFKALSGTYVWPQPCVHWSSSDTTKLSVSENGRVFAHYGSSLAGATVSAFLGVSTP